MARKLQLADLPANPDPRAALDTPTFLRAARPVLAALTADLLARADADPGIRAALEQHHKAELEASRTADDYPVWRRHIVVQVAVAWLLSCVFVRVLEDRSLIAPRIAGAGVRDGEEAFFRVAPSLGEREYLLIVFRELARLPAAAPLFAPEHNLVWRLGPSAEGCKQLMQLFRTPHADAPTFRFGYEDTRFLGDLYQYIDDGVRERFALLQTPDFIESFILDRTLEPAIAEYGIDHTDVIDPTCGSGHFLLGAFPRFLRHLRDAHPLLNDRELANMALSHIYGADINPYAISIARCRLILCFIDFGAHKHLIGVPSPHINLIVADSLLHRSPEQDQKSGRQNLSIKQRIEQCTIFSLERHEISQRLLANRRYAAVVGNPPYITVKDRALRETYREQYESASGKYSLSAPFIERFFQFAKEEGGHVGQITSSSFTKREFGAALIEKVLTNLDLELIINTSGVYIPGHGTPTLIIIGRNRKPANKCVNAVLAKRGEPSTPEIPSNGLVWTSIINHCDDERYEDDFISTETISLQLLARHPWPLEGGGASDLKRRLEQACALTIKDVSKAIGPASFTGIDEAFTTFRHITQRDPSLASSSRPFISGNSIRDWQVDQSETALCPYSKITNHPLEEVEIQLFHKIMWPCRTSCERTISFGGKSKSDLGAIWWHWYRWHNDRYRAPLRIIYSFIGTHNHFALDRGGIALGGGAPVIVLRPGTDEAYHQGLVAYLNSSTTCFYIKQSAFPKGTPSADASAEKGKSENNRFDFSSAVLQTIPLPSDEDLLRLSIYSIEIEALIKARKNLDPTQVFNTTHDPGSLFNLSISEAQAEEDRLREQMVSVQEDLDWFVYSIFNLSEPATARRWSRKLGLAPSQRPFSASQPPHHLEPQDLVLWRERRDAINSSKELTLLESPVHKRQWRASQSFGHKVATYAERVADAAIEHIADLAEQVLRARCERSMPTVFTARDLERDLDRDPKYHALRDYLHTTDPARDPLRDQLTRESVPFLAGYRYSPAGRDRHERWREVWALQRIADVSEAELPPLREAAAAAATSASEGAEALSALRQHLGFPTFPLPTDPTPSRRGARKPAPPPPAPPPEDPASKPPELLAAEAHELAARGVQNQARLALEAAEANHHKLRKLIPVPSKYEPTDFRDPNYFRLRGKLDVPRERFISYPGAASDGDPSPVYGWAGWDHLQRALALLQLYYHRKLEETWPGERLIPLLAGLEELLPWVRQWHADERHPDTGERYADALDAHIAAGCSELGVTRPQLVAWAPSETRRGRAPSPVNRSHKTTAPRTESATPSIANRSSRRSHAVTLSPEAPPPEITNKRRAGRRPAETPSTADSVAVPAAPRRRGRPRNAG